MTFNKSTVTRLADDVLKALSTIEKKYGVTVVSGGGKFNPETFTMKLEFSVPTENGNTKEEKDLARALKFHTNLSKVAKSTVVDRFGHTCTLVGYLPRKNKYQWVIKDESGKRRLYTTDAVHSLFKVTRY